MCACESERERAKEGSCANENNDARDEESVRSGGNPKFKIKMLLCKCAGCSGAVGCACSRSDQNEKMKTLALNTILCLKQFLIFKSILF